MRHTLGMRRRHIGLALELSWPLRRHLDVFAGTQKYGSEAPGWTFEIDEFVHERLGGRRKVYDGLIARATPELARAARRAGIPLVNVWFNSPVREELPGVFPDYAEVGRLAGEHLVERGFRHFGCLGAPGDHGYRILSTAYHRAIGKVGGRCLCARATRSYYETARQWTHFQAELDRWIRSVKPPAGLFVTLFDATARYVVHAVRRHGLRVPEDVALITPVNEPQIGLLPPPSLTSVEVNYERVGFRAARMLDLLMRGKRPSELHERVAPGGVVARDSTDYFAVEDPQVAAALRHIEKNLGRRLTVGDVAAAVAPRRTLERRFRKTAGRSIAAEIRRLRILKAKRLLSETVLLVKQVAKECGFGDPVRLHEAFVRETGMSPGAYRRETTSAS